MSMKKKLAGLMAMSMLAFGIMAGCGGSDANGGSNANGGDAQAEGGTLRMGTNATFPPYEMVDENNNVIGIDADIAKAIADKLGMELEIINMEFDALIPALNAGQIDFSMAGMTASPERAEQVDFTTSYATGIQAIIVPEDSEIAAVEDLADKKVGVQTGTTGDQYCSGDLGEDHVQRFESGVVATQALVNGQIDAVVIDNAPAKAYVEANEGLKILDTEYTVEDYAAAVAKDNTEMYDKINGVLEELKAAGTIDEIIAKYIHE